MIVVYNGPEFTVVDIRDLPSMILVKSAQAMMSRMRSKVMANICIPGASLCEMESIDEDGQMPIKKIGILQRTGDRGKQSWKAKKMMVCWC